MWPPPRPRSSPTGIGSEGSSASSSPIDSPVISPMMGGETRATSAPAQTNHNTGMKRVSSLGRVSVSHEFGSEDAETDTEADHQTPRGSSVFAAALAASDLSAALSRSTPSPEMELAPEARHVQPRHHSADYSGVHAASAPSASAFPPMSPVRAPSTSSLFAALSLQTGSLPSSSSSSSSSPFGSVEGFTGAAQTPFASLSASARRDRAHTLAAADKSELETLAAQTGAFKCFAVFLWLEFRRCSGSLDFSTNCCELSFCAQLSSFLSPSLFRMYFSLFSFLLPSLL